MAATPEPRSKTAEGEIVVTHVFDAPRELVWRAWTEPEHFRKWWGPAHFTSPVCRMDLRVGGAYLWSMRSPRGQDFYNTGVYREIVPLERLVCTHSLSDQNGRAVPPSHYGMPGDWPMETLVTVTLEDDHGRTRMTLRQSGMPAGSPSGAGAGWKQAFDKLAGSLRNLEFVMTREFNAPRRLVFEAHSSCEHLKHWWGPRTYEVTFCEVDFRPGGRWRIAHAGPDGKEHGFRGEYREITAPETIVQTFEYEGDPGNVLIETLTLVEQDGKTLLTARSLAPSAAVRDAMVGSGMEEGARETYDRLAEYLATLR